MKWSTVCKAKLKRGLGVRSLSLLNKAFLCKWCWQFSNEKEPSWKNIIKGKFEEEERGYRLGVLREPYGVRVRRAIGKQWDMFNSKASFAVGSRSRVKFWKDRWYNEEPLCETFPSLFALSDSKEAWVAYLWEQRGKGGSWNIRFVKNLNDWELVVMEQFLLKLQGQTMKREKEDTVVRKGDSKGVFSMRELYSLLKTGCVIPFPLKIIWKSWIPSNVSFFT